MAFIGSICQPLRKFFATHARLLAGRQVYVGCSGNFTIESILSSVCPTAEIYSNDVSLYSTAVGYMLTDRLLPLEIVHPELLWMNDYAAKGAEEQVEVLMLLIDLLGFEKRNNQFKQRMWQAHVDQFPAMFAANRIEKMHYTLATQVADAVRKLSSGSATAPDRFTYQVLGATADGSGFPAHEGLISSYKEAVECLTKCWRQGTGWIEIRKAGETIAHVCFNQGRRYKVYLFNKGERS